MKFIPFIKSTPPDVKRRLSAMLLFLLIFNIGIWIITFILSVKNPILLGLVTLAYGLGLRHAVDADHIAAIDNTTRKLMQDNQRPVAVGFFFSLGHSTIVILLSFLIAFSTAFVKRYLPALQENGSLIGTTVSSIFLLTVGIINLVLFIDIYKIWTKVMNDRNYKDASIDKQLDNRGFLTRLIKPIMKTVKHSWNMYIVGFLFGLGFDTASEVGLLSISAASAASGMHWINILILPLAFTAGMSLVDTLDGILMLGAYGWAYINPVRKLYYNLNITFISVFVALVIGGIEALQIISTQLKLKGAFFSFINNVDFNKFGYIIIGIFVISWILSISVYKIKRYDYLE